MPVGVAAEAAPRRNECRTALCNALGLANRHERDPDAATAPEPATALLAARCRSEPRSEPRLASESCGSLDRPRNCRWPFPAFMKTRYSRSTVATTGEPKTSRAALLANRRSLATFADRPPAA
jgi:hypothetical protein